MARLSRVVAVGLPHHIVQRGNRRQDVFFGENDRDAYIEYMQKACEEHGVKIWAWCLMTNHVHFIAVPEKEESLCKCFADVHVRYTRRINFRKKWRGHLWQGRFGSSPLDERYLLAVARYIERNPVRAGLVKMPWRYKWSSAGYHVGESNLDSLVNGDELLQELAGDWKEYLRERDDEGDLAAIRREEASGRPIGNAAFVGKLEKKLERVLKRGVPGRRRIIKGRIK